MSPGARISASITILDNIIGGAPVNKSILNWFRSNRFAGSKDRFAIREIIFNCLRYQRSSLWSFKLIGLPENGRSLVIGTLCRENIEILAYFNGKTYCPDKISEREQSAVDCVNESLLKAPISVMLDFPEFLEKELFVSLGEALRDTMLHLNRRAQVYLRVNLMKSTVDAVIKSLLSEGVLVKKCPTTSSGLLVLNKVSKIEKTKAYIEGRVEIQDISSQAVIEFINPQPNMMILDYCAGGGGKTLAIASFTRGKGQFFAYDKNENRMNDLRERSKRSGVKVKILKTDQLFEIKSKFNLVLADVPCSGIGAWRRNPGGKWWLTLEKLGGLLEEQRKILLEASEQVLVGGCFVYVTCSLLYSENRKQIRWFLSNNTHFYLDKDKIISPLEGGDGFYVCLLKRIK